MADSLPYESMRCPARTAAASVLGRKELAMSEQDITDTGLPFPVKRLDDDASTRQPVARVEVPIIGQHGVADDHTAYAEGDEGERTLSQLATEQSYLRADEGDWNLVRLSSEDGGYRWSLRGPDGKETFYAYDEEEHAALAQREARQANGRNPWTGEHPFPREDVIGGEGYAQQGVVKFLAQQFEKWRQIDDLPLSPSQNHIVLALAYALGYQGVSQPVTPLEKPAHDPVQDAIRVYREERAKADQLWKQSQAASEEADRLADASREALRRVDLAKFNLQEEITRTA